MRGTSRNLRAAASRQQLAGVANDSTTTEAHNVTIESTEAVIKILKDNVNITAKPYEVRKIMRETLGMSYRKIKPMSIHTNSEKNLVLR